MPNWKPLIALSVVFSPLAACGDEPPCPAGSERRGNVCVEVMDAVEPADGEPSDAGYDGSVDAGCSDGGCECPPGTLVYLDIDGDGVGEGEGVEGCPGGDYVAASGDCEPTDPNTFPGNPELCNGTDEDCDDEIDEGALVNLYVDADGDGHGDKDDPGEEVCAGQSIPGKVLSHDDCNDRCDTCTPDNALETACDGMDDDCNGEIDDGVSTTYRLDCDGDFYLPNPEDVVELSACDVPALPPDCSRGKWLEPPQVMSGVDCAPRDANRYPGAEEVCDELDNDCNALVDDSNGVANALRQTYRLDCDGDGHVKSTSITASLCPNSMRPAPQGCTVSGSGVEYRPQWLAPADVRSGVDCADADAEAYPESEHSSTQHVGGRPANDFDYNCNNVQDKVGQVCGLIETCTGSLARKCFVGSLPGCGVSGEIQIRMPAFDDPQRCVVSAGMEQLACR